MFGVMEGRGQHQAAQGSSPGPPDTRKQAQRRLQRVWGHFSGVTGCGERMWPGTVWGERGAGASRRCPRRALGPINSAWAKGRGRRAALRRTAAFVISRVALSQKPLRLNIALWPKAAPTGSKAGCNCEGFWRVREYRLQVPAVPECHARSRTPAERLFQRVPLQAARAGERPLLQTSGGCNYGMTSRIFSRYTRCLLWPSCV